MKIKCGTDIIEVARIQESIENLGEKFLNRVFTDKEIEYCISKKNMQYQHFAARFAAKEAIFKAISDCFKNKYDITWKNIEILNDKKGRPYVHFIGLTLNEIQDMDISLSHLKEYAIATCSVILK